MTDRMAEKQEWLSQVLGVQIATASDMRASNNGSSDTGASGAGASDTGASGFAEQWAAALGGWQAAIETVDRQITALQGALRNDDHPALKAIGDAGLNAVTGNHKVKLMAALIGVGQASDTTRQAACKKAEQLALEFGLHLASDPRVAACDKNPLGIAVSISKTLGPALARLEIVLGQGQREQGVRA